MYLLLLGTSLTLICCQPSKPDAQIKESVTENANTMESNSPVTDYLHVPGPISFNQNDYLLSWSSHPSDEYFKHEYLTKGENQDHYDHMIMLEVALGDLVPIEIAKGKANAIEGRKSVDPMAACTVSDNKKTGEVLLDFMLSAGSGDSTIVEWNSYRYKSYIGPSGEKGIMLFALSKRSYGAEGNTFATDINANRKKYNDEFEGVNYPEIKL